MVSIASNFRLENWTVLDMDQNWTDRKIDLDPELQNLYLMENGHFWIKRKMNLEPKTGFKARIKYGVYKSIVFQHYLI